MSKKAGIGIILGCLGGALVSMMLFFRLFCGIFVIQPIGAIPEGVTIAYWRSGLNIPFVSSADGLLDSSGAGVSPLGRAFLLAELSDLLLEKELFRFGYSEWLYLQSTGGKKYRL